MFEEMVGWAVEEGADMLIGETFYYAGEALAALDVMKRSGRPGGEHRPLVSSDLPQREISSPRRAIDCTSTPSRVLLRPGQNCPNLGWRLIQASIEHLARCRSTASPCSPGSTASASLPMAAGGPRTSGMLGKIDSAIAD
jgi:hypothetical protein